MSQEAVVRHVPLNPCCELLQKKESKLSQKLAKCEEGRNFLKKAIGILQDKITNFEAENVKLKEELEQAHAKAEDDGAKKVEESASRDTLENEISVLRSEISCLKQKSCSGSEDVDEKVAGLQARVSEGEKEICILKEHLEKERMRADNEKKMAERELKKANEALESAKTDIMARAQKLQADNEREMKMNESTLRVSLENEISSLKSQITVLQQQTVSGAQDANKETTLLQKSVSEQKAEINRLKELLQMEKNRADSEKKKAEEVRKKADDEKHRVEKVLSDSETELRVKESVIVSKEDEISSLKSQITLLQKQAVFGAQNVNKDIILLQDCISNKEKEINRLNELLQIEKHRAESERNKAEEERNKVNEKKVWAEKLIAENEREMKLKESAVRLPLENEISFLKSQVELLQQQVNSGAQDVSKSLGAQDVNEETVNFGRRISERETEINRLKKLLQKEKNRADSEKKKAETEKCRAEKVLADSERDLKEKEQAGRLSLEIEISALKSQIHLLQQEIAVRDEKKEVNLYKTLVSKKEAEINQLKKLVEKERTRAESEKKKAEAGKKKVIELQNIAKTEKSRADEEKRLADIERKNVEETRLQLEILRAEVHNVRANLESEALKVLQANENLETEKQKVIKERQRADMEIAKAEEQSKLLETMRREIVEEHARAECLSLQLEEDRGKLTKLQKEIGNHESSRNAGKGSGDCVDTTSMKLLRKTLKLERMQKKHAKQVASLEKDRNILLQQEIRRIKEAFSGIVDHLDILEKCSSHRDGGINDLVKNSNVSRRQGLKRKFLDEEQCQVHHSGNELMKSSSPLDAYDTFKHRKQCSAPLLSSKDCTEPLSGIGSELMPLLGGTKQALLKTSATNSTMASFSNRALLGSQEGLALSVGVSEKSAEGTINLQLTVPGQSNNISKPRCNKKFVPLAENSVRCPLRINALGHEVGVDKNGNRCLDAVKLSEYMNHEGKKRCRQITENVSVQQDMLECSIGKQLRETGGLLSNIDHTDQERENAVSVEEIVVQHLTVSDELKTYSPPIDTQPMFDVTGTAHACNEDTGDASRNFFCSFNEVEDGDYLKLLSLDNPFDEEIYRVARERPLSPTLPKIGSLSVGAHEKDNNDRINVVPPHSDNMVPFCSTVEEIDFSKLNAYTSGTCHVPLLPEKVGVPGSHEIVENNDMYHTSDPSNLGRSFSGHKGLNVSSGSNPQPACSPRYYVVFSDITSNNSISKISSATRICMARCSMLPRTDHVVQVMSTLLKVEGLLSREMVCVFFSLLLQSVPEFALENFKNLTDGGLVFSQQVHSVMDDLETRSIEELLNLDELLSLIEDFLIHRKVLLHCDVLSESLPLYDPESDIIMSGGNMLSFQAASDQQLISASVVLASICLAVDHIGFLCETSYNMLKMRKFDSSTLAILHVFAYISGAKYFTNCDHSLSMTVIKSLVTVLEREMPSSTVQFGFPPCKNCPYSVSAIPMDVVVSMLIKKLHNYVLSNVSYEDLREATVYMNDEAPNSNENREPSSGDGEKSCVQCDKFDVPCCSHKARMSTSCRTLLYLGDVLSLLELVASNMNWSWSFTNIVQKLLEILDSCGIEKLVPAIVVLLGQLGRLGVDANGYDDTGVKTLRGRLSSFLHRKASTVTGLPFQIATVTALLEVIPLRFEELFKSNNELSEVVKDSGPANCIRDWFSLLSKEQQSLSVRVLLNNVTSLRIESTLLQV